MDISAPITWPTGPLSRPPDGCNTGRLSRPWPGWQPRFPQGSATVRARDSNQTAPNVRLFTKETEQTQLALGIRACSRHDPRRYALRLLNTILGENMSSRLFQVVREDRGLAYSIYSSLGFFDDAGSLTISAGLDVDNLPKTLKLVMRELSRLVEPPPGAVELRRARDYVIGQIDLSLESTDNQMMWLGEQPYRARKNRFTGSRETPRQRGHRRGDSRGRARFFPTGAVESGAGKSAEKRRNFVRPPQDLTAVRQPHPPLALRHTHNYAGAVVKQPLINVEEKIDRLVGRRSKHARRTLDRDQQQGGFNCLGKGVWRIVRAARGLSLHNPSGSGSMAMADDYASERPSIARADRCGPTGFVPRTEPSGRALCGDWRIRCACGQLFAQHHGH